ncbi:pyridoxamine 5'-phosphate oxidase family protein [Mycobacteroides chelonae]|uniref:pyridoxamine 5'-phosphate oxidase family protein n=1 Tax=Mycobacteroides chelonae TaxID=1774 RepID=UPI0012FF7878
MRFTTAELHYLQEQPIGQFRTVGRSGIAHTSLVEVRAARDGRTLDVIGNDLDQAQKWRHIVYNPEVRLSFNDPTSISPNESRGIEIHGIAALLIHRGNTAVALNHDVVRIMPQQIIASWIDGERGATRDAPHSGGRLWGTHEFETSCI